MFATLVIGLIVTVSIVVTYSALIISSPEDDHGYQRNHQTSLPPSKYFSFETSNEFLSDEEEQD